MATVKIHATFANLPFQVVDLADARQDDCYADAELESKIRQKLEKQAVLLMDSWLMSYAGRGTEHLELNARSPLEMIREYRGMDDLERGGGRPLLKSSRADA